MAAVIRSRRAVRRRAIIALAAAAAVVLLWLAGLAGFAAEIPLAVEDRTTRTDAIVVVTGGSKRLVTGFELLARGMARKLFISGVHKGVEVEELLLIARHSPADVECCVVLGYSAEDTRGNAAETAHWMAEEGYTSVRLVTANYHMKRSLAEFRRVMPDLTIIPNPVFPRNVRPRQWWRFPGSAKLIIGEYNKYLLATLLNLIVPDASVTQSG